MLILSALANHYRLQKLGAVDQFVMMYGGLRGAVAFALVLLVDPHVVPHAHMFVTTTIAMIYWTVFVQVIFDKYFFLNHKEIKSPLHWNGNVIFFKLNNLIDSEGGIVLFYFFNK